MEQKRDGYLNFDVAESRPVKKGKLVEVAAFFPLLRLLIEPENFVDDFHVRKQHPPATVPFNP